MRFTLTAWFDIDLAGLDDEAATDRLDQIANTWHDRVSEFTDGLPEHVPDAPSGSLTDLSTQAKDDDAGRISDLLDVRYENDDYEPKR